LSGLSVYLGDRQRVARPESREAAQWGAGERERGILENAVGLKVLRD